MSGLSKRETVGSTPYVFCPRCGDRATGWDRPVMQKDRITYRSRRCFSCRSMYRVAILVVDKNPTAVQLLASYHDQVAAGASVETAWPEED